MNCWLNYNSISEKTRWMSQFMLTIFLFVQYLCFDLINLNLIYIVYLIIVGDKFWSSQVTRLFSADVAWHICYRSSYHTKVITKNKRKQKKIKSQNPNKEIKEKTYLKLKDNDTLKQVVGMSKWINNYCYLVWIGITSPYLPLCFDNLFPQFFFTKYG